MGKEYKLQHLYSNLALLLTAFILGLSFVAQKAGMEFVGPFTFNTVRNFLGVMSLLPIIFIAKIYSSKKYSRSKNEIHIQHKLLAKGGIICGILFFLALSINQYCMLYAPAGKAGFITALYIIFVPLISVVFFKRKLKNNVKISIILALTGLYLLCVKESSPFQLCDLGLLISSIFFALHLLAVGHYSHKISSIKLACIQFLVTAILSAVLMFILEPVSVNAIINGIKPILFSGVVVTGVAYTLQIYGQKNTPPVLASLILSMESVFAVLGGMAILGETLTFKEGLGCIIMISAILLSQLRFAPRAMKRLKRINKKVQYTS